MWRSPGLMHALAARARVRPEFGVDYSYEGMRSLLQRMEVGYTTAAGVAPLNIWCFNAQAAL